jgi:hypothetical protein
VQRLYSLQNAKGDPRSSQCVVEFEGCGAFLDSDFASFQLETSLTLPFPKLVGPVSNFSTCQSESTLDLDYAAGVGIGNTNWFWSQEVSCFFIVPRRYVLFLSVVNNPALRRVGCTSLHNLSCLHKQNPPLLACLGRPVKFISVLTILRVPRLAWMLKATCNV